MISYRPATSEDAKYLAFHMRDIDRLEWTSFDDTSPETQLRLTIEDKPAGATVGVMDGIPFCIFGCTPGVKQGTGNPWLAGTDNLEYAKKSLVVKGREMVRQWSRQYSYLENLIHADNVRAIEWLKRIGFGVDTGTQYLIGKHKHPYHLFYKHTQCVTP